MADRNVLERSPSQKNDETHGPQPFSAFADRSNLVLLGDPGAGKTHLFQEAAAASGGRYLTARHFLLARVTSTDTPLFIDALDETRSGRGDQDAINTFVQKLFTVVPPKVRIACREADWLGDTDRAAFNIYFQEHGGVTELQLRALSPTERRGVLMAERNTGVAATAAEAINFLKEAERRGLEEFTLNPQNLLMLWEAVRSRSIWPKTRKELLELSTSLLLSEHNRTRQRSGVGIFTPEELRDAAGAHCAMRLVSDVEGVSLQESGDGEDFPSYRSLPFITPEKSLAALGRRVFVAAGRSETVDYAHRTTAEFLGAAWIAAQVRCGLPIGRVLALIGVDGHPASELRGLHAWLAVFLPDNANRLIEADPYGVLVYSDAASLSASGAKYLLEALAKLSQRDPWFRSGRWASPALGMLARPDMVESFRRVLNSASANFGLRSVVVDVLATGTALPEMLPDLASVVGREQSPFAERQGAMIALERLGQPGKDALTLFCRSNPPLTENTLRLRADIIASLFAECFNAVDIAALLADVANCAFELMSDVLWVVGKRLPLGAVPEVINAIQPPSPQASSNPLTAQQLHQVRLRNGSQVHRTLEQLLLRYVKEAEDTASAHVVLRALKLLRAFGREAGRLMTGDIAKALEMRSKILHEIVDLQLDVIDADDELPRPYNEFLALSAQMISPEALSRWLTDYLPRAGLATKKERLIFQIALSQCWTGRSLATERFEELSDLAAARRDLKEVYDEVVVEDIPDWRREDSEREIVRRRQEARQMEATLKEFVRNVPSIRGGQNNDWLAWAADIYFGQSDDLDLSTSPIVRLNTVLGEANAATVLEGFAACLQRVDLPPPADVASIGIRGERGVWWHALLAGLEEKWGRGSSIDSFSDDFWRSVLSIELVAPIFDRQENKTWQQNWHSTILEERPDLAREAYEAVARVYLAGGKEHVTGLHELLHEPALEKFRVEVALDLLDAFPFPAPYALTDLLECALVAASRRSDLTQITRRVVAQPAVADQQRLWDRWLVLGFLISPDEFLPLVKDRLAADPNIVWTLRDLTGTEFGRNPSYPLTLSQVEAIACAVGTRFPEAHRPSGVMNGNTNAWDAADFVRSLINVLSASSTVAAGDALERLEANPALTSYRDAFRHALATQHARRRDAEYHRPNWDEATASFANRSPANAADLCALTVAQLEDIAVYIRSANTDPYKQFWNVDRYGRLKVPRPEETCRDALLTLLRPRLIASDMTAEPEGHMADDKRADIAVSRPGIKALVELKKDVHDDVWSAAETQLDRFYTRDPEAAGFGIYGVFWFGDKRQGKLPSAPGRTLQPKTASEMADTLRALLPESARARIAVVVFDVSGPVAPISPVRGKKGRPRISQRPVTKKRSSKRRQGLSKT